MVENERIAFLVRPTKAIPASVQVSFAPAGAVIYTIPKETRAEWLNSTRKGERCGMSDLALLAELKSRKHPHPVPDLIRTAGELRKRGVNFVEFSTGRTFKADYEAMLADAVEQIRTGRRAGVRGKSGRKPNAFTKEQIRIFNEEWFSRKHEKLDDAIKAIKARILSEYGRDKSYLINKTSVRRALIRAGKIKSATKL